MCTLFRYVETTQEERTKKVKRGFLWEVKNWVWEG